MIEVHEWLYDSANAYWLAGGIINTLIGCVIFMIDLYYLIHLFCIPFYIRDIAKNTGRK